MVVQILLGHCKEVLNAQQIIDFSNAAFNFNATILDKL
jgi:hypothetical protein